MLTDVWSIGLLSCSAVTLFLLSVGAKTGWRIFRFWNVDSDSELQIRLEEEVYLSAALVEFGFAVQLLSVAMLVLAADYFSTILVGAMCAAGSLTANGYGIPALLVKLMTLFLSAAWLVCHKLDTSSEYYPLVKRKYLLLFCILPLLFLDSTLLFLYLYNLKPDIITSCCGVLFSNQDSNGFNLLNIMPTSGLLTLYGAMVFMPAFFTHRMSRQASEPAAVTPLTAVAALGLWAGLYFFSLVVITVHTSPYVYAMPHHRCPFDLLKAPFQMIGYPLYFFLHGSVIGGISCAVAALVEGQKGLAESAARLRRRAGRLSLIFLALFLLMIVYHPMMYWFRGGE